ncbi:MAG: hypothetical protein Tsb002_07180 [Wenzhouxiangellaceae bacterium]
MPQLTDYHQQFQIRWADLDANGHMRHSAYLDFPAQVRIAYFNDHGYGLAAMQRLRLGPVLFSEQIEYRREVRDNEKITVDVGLMGLSENRKHWLLRHQVFRADGDLAALLLCRGAWLDLDQRRICAPPDDLYEALAQMPRTDDYSVIGGNGG